MTRFRKRVALTAGAAALLAIGGLTVQAAQQPDYLVSTLQFEVAHGAKARAGRTVAHDPVWSRSHADWNRFLAVEGGTWRSMWDAQTRVPLRIYGSGVEAPGSMADDAAAATYAKQYLDRHLGLLAPGASLDDFQMVSNAVFDGMRSVGFYQHHDGMRVIGGQVSFRFKNDRMFVIGSEALPNVSAPRSAPSVTRKAATERALDWVRGDYGSAATSLGVDGPFILPVVRNTDVTAPVEYSVVWQVTVDSTQPIGRWRVYVDAHDGKAIARQQILYFANGTVRYNAPLRWPGDTRADLPALFARLDVDGVTTEADVNGVVSWPSGTASVVTRVLGDFVRIINDGTGGLASTTLSLPDGGTAVWNESASEVRDAQLATYIHTNLVQEYMRAIDPALPFLGQQMQATVNISQTCNAFSDAAFSINFFREGGGCSNTGRMADVVYHEFGHSLHGQAIIPGVGDFDGSMSEGVGDYLAATIVDDPAMGRGFFLNNDPLRNIDPVGSEAVFPDDFTGEVHSDGLIYSGALWDLRKDLISTLGGAAGVAHNDRLFYASVRRASDIPTSYVEVLAADDDDGNIANGTPNSCLIDRNFGMHGLAPDNGAGSLSISAPIESGLDIRVEVREPAGDCPVPDVSRATLTWQLRSNASVGDTLTMNDDGAGDFTASLPPQEQGEVINYQVVMELSDGTQRVFPNNPADPMYELFVGDTVEIYCTDFETDPFLEGWTHALDAGTPGEGADDWQWGVPQSTGGGDPPVAFSGNSVIGNDLGGGNFNGLYQPDKVNHAESPVIDVSGFDNIRLQYRRWLNVEDGFFDQGRIYVNGVQAFGNLNSNQGNDSNVHHTDKEWRFQDIDITSLVQDDSVQVRFELQSDAGLEFGGWTIDDFCIVAFIPAECGDGVVGGVEQCDNGAGNSDTEADACRSDCTAAACGDGVVDTDEACDDGNLATGDGCDAVCAVEDGFEPPGTETGGCCQSSGTNPGTPLLLGLVMLCLGVILRRRRTA